MEYTNIKKIVLFLRCYKALKKDFVITRHYLNIMYLIDLLSSRNITPSFINIKNILWYNKHHYNNKAIGIYLKELIHLEYITMDKIGRSHVHKLTAKGISLLNRFETLLRDTRPERKG